MDATIKNLILETDSVEGYQFVAGLVAINDEAISNSSVSGKVKGIMGIAGGAVGSNRGTANVSNSFTSTNVEGNAQLGGLVGSNSSTIKNSFATGEVKGNNYVGGLVGINQGGATIVEKSYAIGKVTGTNGVGGLVGKSYGAVQFSYYDESTQQNDTGKGERKTTAEMKHQDTYQGWDFTTTWSIDPQYNNNKQEDCLIFSGNLF